MRRLLARIEKVKPGGCRWRQLVVGGRHREKAHKRAVTSPGRKVLLRKLERMCVAAKTAADEDQQREQVDGQMMGVHLREAAQRELGVVRVLVHSIACTPAGTLVAAFGTVTSLIEARHERLRKI